MKHHESHNQNVNTIVAPQHLETHSKCKQLFFKTVWKMCHEQSIKLHQKIKNNFFLKNRVTSMFQEI